MQNTTCVFIFNVNFLWAFPPWNEQNLPKNERFRQGKPCFVYIEKSAFYPINALKTKHICRVTPFTLHITGCVFIFKVKFSQAFPVWNEQKSPKNERLRLGKAFLVYIEKYAFYHLELLKTKLNRHVRTIHFVKRKKKAAFYLQSQLPTSFSR